MDNNENQPKITDETGLQETASVQVSKHCPDETCVMYMMPQPNRKYCIECGTELVY